MEMNTEVKGVVKVKVSTLSAQIIDGLRLSRPSVPEPETSREALEDEIAARRIIIAEAQSQIAALKSHQNELLPIHRLPVEILSIVLFMALPLEGYHKERTKFLLVCRTWTNIIHGNPSAFWTTLSVEDPRSQRARLLQKSGQLPVTIITGGSYASPKRSKDFMKYIKSQGLSFRALVLHEWDEARMKDVFANCLAAPAPHLRSLNLRVGNGWVLRGDDPNLQHLRMFSGVAPKLRAIRLSGVAIPWNSAILRGLLSLSLEYPGGRTDGAPSLEQVLGILQGCPALQSLTLWALTFDQSNQSVALPQLSLDQLMMIKLWAMSFQSTLVILRHIQFPKPAAVAIKIIGDVPHDDDDDDHDTLSTILSLLQEHLSIRSLQLVIDQPLLTFSTMGFTISVPNRAWRHPNPCITYKRMLSALSFPTRAAITSLHMDFISSRDATAPLLAMNDFIPNLTELSVILARRLKSKKPWNGVLEKVVQPTEDTSRPMWLCPKLTSLEISVGDPSFLDLAAILHLVRTRNSDRKSKGKQVPKSLITSIRIALQSGRLLPEQTDLLNELRIQVPDVQYETSPEPDEAINRYDTRPDSGERGSFLSSSSDSFDSDW